MRKRLALDHFGTATALAKKLNITAQAISQWDELVPPLRAQELAEITHGILKFDPSEYAGSKWERLAGALSQPNSAA